MHHDLISWAIKSFALLAVGITLSKFILAAVNRDESKLSLSTIVVSAVGSLGILYFLNMPPIILWIILFFGGISGYIVAGDAYRKSRLKKRIMDSTKRGPE